MCYQKGWFLYSDIVVILKGQKAIKKITSGGEEIPLTVDRLCRMKVLPSEALEMNGSLYLTIGYLLKNVCKGFRVIVHKETESRK